MGSKLKSALLMLLTIVICLSAATVQAATVSQDNIEVTLSTDKTEYEAGEQIQVTLEISNKGENDVAPVTVRYSIPNTCTMAGGSSIVEEIDMLKSGETKTVEATLTVIKQPTAAKVPSTGDHSNIFLWIALAAVSLFGLSRMGAQNLKRLFAIVLCISLMGSMLPVGAGVARAEEMKKVIREGETEETEEAADSGEEQGQLINIPEDPSKVAPFILNALKFDQQSESEAAAEISESEAETLNALTDGLDAAELDAAARRAAAKPEEYEDEAAVTVNYTSIDWENASEHTLVVAGGELKTQEPDAGKKDPVQSEGSSLVGTIVVSETIRIAGREKEISATVSYGSDQEQSSGYNNSLSWYLNKNLNNTITSNSVIKYSKIIKKTSTALPKSSHPYKNNTDHIYLLETPSDAAGMTLFLSNKTELESNYDGLIFYDGNLNYKGYLTGYAGGISYTATGAGMALRLISDASRTYYGFQSSKIILHKQPKISSCKVINAAGDVKLTWKKLSGYSGYAIERAEVGPGGNYGTFVTLVAYGSSKATSFTDYTTVPGKRYAYRMRQLYADIVGDYYGGVYSPVSELTIPGYLPATNEVYLAGAGASKVMLQWEAVDGADGYAIYKGTNPYKTLKLATRVANPFATISAAKSGNMSYYTVRPYMKSGKYYVYGGESGTYANYALAVPSSMKIAPYSYDRVKVSWKKVSKAQTYEIYISDNEYDGYRYLGWVDAAGGSNALIPFADIEEVFPNSTRVWIKVAAARYDYPYGQEIGSISKLSAPVSIVYNNDPIEIRSLSVFETNVAGQNPIPTIDRDLAMLSRMFDKATPSGEYADMYYAENLTKTQVVDVINQMAAKADANDVTFFTLSCHGSSHIVSGVNAGSMALKNSTMTFAELATALNKIPGRVVIILTSCGSGSSIDKSAGEDAQEESFDGEAYMQEFIDVIKEYDSEITYVEPAEEGGETAATGELKKANKFYVITAARGGENGIYATWSAGFGFSYLYQWMFNGVVGKMTADNLYYLSKINKASVKGSMPADTNKNNAVTLGELQAYLTKKSASSLFDMDGDGRKEYQMRPQVYPDNSDFVLFKKR